MALRVDGREFAHLHTPTELHLRLRAEEKARKRACVRSDPRVVASKHSRDWILLRADSPDRWAEEIELIQLA